MRTTYRSVSIPDKLRSARSWALFLWTAVGCAVPVQGSPSSFETPSIERVTPSTWLVGTELTVEGGPFVEPQVSETTLALEGRREDGRVLFRIPMQIVGPRMAVAKLDADAIDAVAGGGDGAFSVRMRVSMRTPHDDIQGPTHSVEVDVARSLAPRLDRTQTSGPITVNARLPIEGAGFLRKGEGTTFAVFSGCIEPSAPDSESGVPAMGSTCREAGGDVPLVVETDRSERAHGYAPFLPDIAGVEPGRFEGTLRLQNRHTDGTVRSSASATVRYTFEAPQVTTIEPGRASLGQRVELRGLGFVLPEQGTTGLRLHGTVIPFGSGARRRTLDARIELGAESGSVARYVLNEDDELGVALDPRHGAGNTFLGEATPYIRAHGRETTGASLPFRLEIAPVRQIVHVDFRPQYVAALADFGLRSADGAIRDRILAVLERDYATLGVEFRTEPPADYAIYSVVEVRGRDPSGLDLLGLDATEGKDVGNRRLDDRVGRSQVAEGVTEGGVFTTSLFGFSKHPGTHVSASRPDADATFDAVFDRFRPDRNGRPVRAADLAEPIEPKADGEGCPAESRAEALRCAVFVLGSLLGNTISHEVGHTLGLPEPNSDAVHPSSDRASRLMDAGEHRPFLERAELFGFGPARFCDRAYAYLRRIVPAEVPADMSPRPSCDQ